MSSRDEVGTAITLTLGRPQPPRSQPAEHRVALTITESLSDAEARTLAVPADGELRT